MALADSMLSGLYGREVRPGEFIEIEPDILLGHDAGMPLAVSVVQEIGGMVHDPSKIVMVMDHFVPAPNDVTAKYQKIIRGWARKLGIRHYYEVGRGVCHQIVLEEGLALPGRVIAGADSHTLTCGALGALGISVGVTELGVTIATGKLWLKVPETLFFRVDGIMPQGVGSKDLSLYILKFIYDRKIPVDYKVVEFTGTGISGLTVGDRAVLCNMMAEAGVKSALVRPDQGVRDYLESLGLSESAGRETVFAGAEDITGDVYDIYLGDLTPLVAVPHSPQSVKPVREVDVPIDQAYLGSCTNGRIEDLRVAAAILKGRKVHRGVRMLISPASARTMQQAVKEGLIETFLEAGATITGCWCGACFGGHMGLLAEGERCISSTNRNFPARMGHAGSEVYLAGPATVAASAVAGRITDPGGYL